MDEETNLKLSPEELEDTVQYSQQMTQHLLEIIGETLQDVAALRRENAALRSAFSRLGLDCGDRNRVYDILGLAAS